MSWVDFTITGTSGSFAGVAGERLVGLMVPLADSTTLLASLYHDTVGNAKVAADAAGAQVAIGGTAQTWNKFVPVPESLGLMLRGVSGMVITTVNQTTGPLACKAYFVEER